MAFNENMGDDSIVRQAAKSMFRRTAFHAAIYLAPAVGAILAVMVVIILLMGPALGMKEVSNSIYAQEIGVGEDEVDGDEAEAYWYDPQNVKKHLDAFFRLLSDIDDGLVYITKNNFIMILDRTIEYQKSIRTVDNAYTYYHHKYEVVAGGTQEVVTPAPGKQLDSQRATDDQSTAIWEHVNTYEDEDGNKRDVYQRYFITDIESTDELGHITNKSPEDDPVFKVSWEEIYTMAAMKSIVGNTRSKNWKTEVKNKGVEKPEIVASARLDEETINSILDAFQFSIGYYFDPTSPDDMGNGESYAGHVYSYDEMENYAYIKSKDGENVEHGTEVYPGTPNFDYYEYKKPAIAPAYASNAYTTIEYQYLENADGTATLVGRQVTIDGERFHKYASDILGEDINMDWFVEFVSMLPGSSYDAGSGSLRERFAKVLKSYKEGKPYSYYDTDFDGCGQVMLGTACSRTDIKYSGRTDGGGNPVIPPADVGITVDDISDEQIRADIEAGLYTLEDLVYTAACVQAEAGSPEGQVAVAWCLRNRVASGNYPGYKAAVTAPGQFASPWRKYLNGSYSAQAQSAAAGVLRGSIPNPIGACYYFFSASSVKGYKPGTFHINIGGNMFYINWGDVTQVPGRPGYVSF